ncbi:MAG: hypothetical protein F6K10_03045 [Moorea sp. SIO2B7]|nr:hypothetical protein [Moorena sp. SIO2B7]
MARTLKVTVNETLSELEKRLSKSRTAREKERLQILNDNYSKKSQIFFMKNTKHLVFKPIIKYFSWRFVLWFSGYTP